MKSDDDHKNVRQRFNRIVQQFPWLWQLANKWNFDYLHLKVRRDALKELSSYLCRGHGTEFSDPEIYLYQATAHSYQCDRLKITKQERSFAAAAHILLQTDREACVVACYLPDVPGIEIFPLPRADLKQILVEWATEYEEALRR